METGLGVCHGRAVTSGVPHVPGVVSGGPVLGWSIVWCHLWEISTKRAAKSRGVCTSSVCVCVCVCVCEVG